MKQIIFTQMIPVGEPIPEEAWWYVLCQEQLSGKYPEMKTITMPAGMSLSRYPFDRRLDQTHWQITLDCQGITRQEAEAYEPSPGAMD